MNISDQTQASFRGWATVEIMGHQQVSGFVETVAFGGSVMFKCSVPALEPTEQVLEKPIVIGYRAYTSGSVIRVSRDAFETYIGSGSIYRLTPVSEQLALMRHGNKIEVVSMAPPPAELPAGGEQLEDDEDEAETAEDEREEEFI